MCRDVLAAFGSIFDQVKVYSAILRIEKRELEREIPRVWSDVAFVFLLADGEKIETDVYMYITKKNEKGILYIYLLYIYVK